MIAPPVADLQAPQIDEEILVAQPAEISKSKQAKEAQADEQQCSEEYP